MIHWFPAPERGFHGVLPVRVLQAPAMPSDAKDHLTAALEILGRDQHDRDNLGHLVRAEQRRLATRGNLSILYPCAPALFGGARVRP